MKVKICGLRRVEDIDYVNEYKPDYIGFIFAESKRQVSFEEAKNLISGLDKGIKTVGVFVNEDRAKVVEAAAICGLDAVQIHGDETPEYIGELKRLLEMKEPENMPEIWKAIRVKDRESLSEMKYYSANAFVLDAFVENSYGGAGKTFDWELAVEAKKYGKIILAGGLSIENISKAVETVQPYGLDVSSGVETDGFKDKEKIKKFIGLVRK